MNKSELIEKLEKKLASILSDYNRIYRNRNGANTLASSECRGRIKDFMDCIKDIKNLNEDTSSERKHD